MQDQLSNYLKKIYNSVELKDNLFAWLLAKYSTVDVANRDKLYSTIFPLYQRHYGAELSTIEYDKISEETKIEKRDYRIKSLQISNFRGFPQSTPPFGLNFTEENEIQSAILLGANGIGKSSIFAALEYVFGGQIGEAVLRNQKNFSEYMTHFNTSFSDCFFQVNTNSGNYNLLQSIFNSINVSNLNPDSHFISDYDIYKNGQINFLGNPDDSSSFHYLIASSLGLQDLMNFNEVINKLSTYKRATEKNKLREFITNKDKFLLEIESWEKEVAQKKNRLVELKTSENNKDAEVQNKLQEKLEFIKSRKDESLGLLYDFHGLKQAIENYFYGYDEFEKNKINSSSIPEIEFLTQGLDLLEKVEYSNCPFCQNSTSHIDIIKSNVNKRVSLYKKYIESYNKYKDLYSFITERVESVFTKVRIIKNYIEKEIELIRPYSELFSLLDEEKELNNFLNTYIANDFYQRVIQLYTDQDSSKNRLADLYEIIEHNLPFIESIDLTARIDDFNTKRTELLNKGEEALNQKISPKTGKEEIILLNNDIKNIQEQISKNKSTIVHFELEIKTLSKSIELFDHLINDAIIYKGVISKDINETVNKYFEPISEITVSILSDYLKNDNVEIELIRDPVIDEDSGEILTEIIKANLKHKESEISLSPNKYFNTFRYRLFCMMVSISIAIASRLKTGINFPIVLDDVFYASDFSRRTTVESFLKNLLNLFSKYSKDMPIQFILFTHDELIFDSAINAVFNTEYEKLTTFSKLLHYSEAEVTDEFLQLNYKMPVKLPASVLHLLNNL